jgi:hypothetical protein
VLAVALAGCRGTPKETAGEPSLQETQATPKTTAGGPSLQAKTTPGEQSLQETQAWMHDFVADRGAGATYEGKDCSAVTNLSDEIGTRVTFSFKDLDPNTATSVHVVVSRAGNVFMAKADTTNELKKVVVHNNLEQTQQSWVEILFRSAKDADRFAKALRRAIVLCGGKPSAFGSWSTNPTKPASPSRHTKS